MIKTIHHPACEPTHLSLSYPFWWCSSCLSFLCTICSAVVCNHNCTDSALYVVTSLVNCYLSAEYCEVNMSVSARFLPPQVFDQFQCVNTKEKPERSGSYALIFGTKRVDIGGAVAIILIHP